MNNTKQSGVSWIGVIPSDWSILRGKNVMTLLNRPVKPDDGVITCFRDGEVTLRSKRREDGFTMSDKEIGYQGIEPGDLVIHGMDGFAGSIGISDSRGKGTPILSVCDSTNNKRFLMYFLRSAAYRNVFLALATGIRVRSCDLRWNKLAVLPFAIPPRKKQDLIASFLETKCGEIDRLIEVEEAQIEKLTSYRLSIITKAVSFGILKSPSASGNGWFPEIGMNARIVPVSRYYRIVLGKMLSPSQTAPDQTSEPYYCAANIHFDSIDKDGLKTMWFSASDKENYLVREGDLMVVEGGAGAGGAHIAPTQSTPTYIQNSVMVVKGKDRDYNLWLYYVLYSLVRRGYIDYVCNKATIPHFTKEKLSATPIPLFPEDEVREVVAYLNKKCELINRLIELRRAKIETLREYKKSLVYEIVTGKKEVS